MSSQGHRYITLPENTSISQWTVDSISHPSATNGHPIDVQLQSTTPVSRQTQSTSKISHIVFASVYGKEMTIEQHTGVSHNVEVSSLDLNQQAEDIISGP